MKIRIYILLISICLLTGCVSWIDGDEAELAKTGPGTIFNPTAVAAYTSQQSAALTQLETMAGVSAAADDWDAIIQAGILYFDELCSQYLDALYLVNKQLDADVRDVNSAGSLVAGLMGIGKSAANEIATVALFFGYSEEAINNSGSRVLFELEPSSIRSLVKGNQLAFRSSLQTGYNSRSGTFAVIREFASLCLPSTIEAEINNAAKDAQAKVAPGNPATGTPPKVSVNANQVSVVTTTFGTNANSKLLSEYAFPAGILDVTNRDQLIQWMESAGIDVPVGIFLISNEYQELWDAAVHFLRANGTPPLGLEN